LGAGAGQLRSPAVHLEPTPTGKGYWILSAAGEVAAFGDAVFRGQLFPLPVNAVGLAATPTGNGYWVANAAGPVCPFGGAVPPAPSSPSGTLTVAGSAPRTESIRWSTSPSARPAPTPPAQPRTLRPQPHRPLPLLRPPRVHRQRRLRPPRRVHRPHRRLALRT